MPCCPGSLLALLRCRLPPQQPTKRLDVLWKTAAKHFEGLALHESDIVLSIAERRGAFPAQSFTTAAHAQMTLQQAYALLPPAPSAEAKQAMQFSGLPADCWAQRLPSVVHLYFDVSEAVRSRLRVAGAAASDIGAPGGMQPSHAAAAPAPARVPLPARESAAAGSSLEAAIELSDTDTEGEDAANMPPAPQLANVPPAAPLEALAAASSGAGPLPCSLHWNALAAQQQAQATQLGFNCKSWVSDDWSRISPSWEQLRPSEAAIARTLGFTSASWWGGTHSIQCPVHGCHGRVFGRPSAFKSHCDAKHPAKCKGIAIGPSVDLVPGSSAVLLASAAPAALSHYAAGKRPASEALGEPTALAKQPKIPAPTSEALPAQALRMRCQLCGENLEHIEPEDQEMHMLACSRVAQQSVGMWAAAGSAGQEPEPEPRAAAAVAPLASTAAATHEATWRCSLCDKAFCSRDALQQHMVNKAVSNKDRTGASGHLRIVAADTRMRAQLERTNKGRSRLLAFDKSNRAATSAAPKSSAEQDATLPEGWGSAEDSWGAPYYYKLATREVQRELPTEAC